MRAAARVMALCVAGLSFTIVQAQTSSPSASTGQAQATSPGDLVRRAFEANRELTAARLDLERGRARLRQAGLRPNPTIDVDHTTGRLTGSPEERELSVGFVFPIEIGGRRQGRIDVAATELAVLEAEIANRERQLAREVLEAYIDLVGATRELDTTERLRQLDEEMVRVVRTRVDLKDAAPLDLSLLLTEAARLDARRILMEARIEVAQLTISQLTGAAQEPVIVRPGSTSLNLGPLPDTLEAALAAALERRADVAIAKLNEQAAEAGVRLARTAAWPDLTVSAGYRSSSGLTELPSPLTALPDSDRVISIGASIGLPLFNRNQGGQTEAAVAVRQARLRRESTEHTVRAEVTGAFRRAEAAQRAMTLLGQSVLTRSEDNIRTVRAAYDLGEFRITDVIAEQRRLLEAQGEYTEALAERYRALIDLRAAIGLAGFQP